MNPRAKRAVAALAVLAFLVAYVVVVITVGARLPDHWLIDLIFYATAGVAWGIPIIPILRWAERP
jgi:hypothetical protein